MGFIHERNNYGDQTALLLQLTIRYEDGTTQVLSTDESWIGANSPVTFSEIYDGEIYDARLEQSGWNAPGFVPKLDESFHHLTEEEKKSLMHDPLTQPFTEEEKKLQRQIAWTYQQAQLHGIQLKSWIFQNSVDSTARLSCERRDGTSSKTVVCDTKGVVVDLDKYHWMYSFSCKGPSGNEGKTALL